MGWRRKCPERQPHQASEQGEDDARAKRKTDDRGRQETRWRGRKTSGHARSAVKMPAGGCPDAMKSLEAARRSTDAAPKSRALSCPGRVREPAAGPHSGLVFSRKLYIPPRSLPFPFPFLPTHPPTSRGSQALDVPLPHLLPPPRRRRRPRPAPIPPDLARIGGPAPLRGPIRRERRRFEAVLEVRWGRCDFGGPGPRGAPWVDAVELPLPAKVEFGKILAPAAAEEGVDGAVPGGGGPGGGGGEVLRRCADADRRHGGDVKQHNQNAEGFPSYRSKRTSLEVPMQKSLGFGLKSENGKRDYVANDTVQSLHKQDSKIVTKKTMKLLDVPPYSKRPKLEPVQTGRDAEAKGHEFISQKNVPDLTPCAASEKSRLLKQKRISDAKRIDKKNIRSGVRSKYDCFSSKAGLANFDSGFSGNSVLGAHGLKSDVRDITNHIENLSLSELLDGTYKYSSLGREKGKKVLRTKEELLVSVRKAFSMLSDMDYCHGKDSNNILSPKLPSASTSSCDIKEQCGDKLSPLVKDSSQINVCDTALRHPKDILSRLTLPHRQDLDSLLAPGSESTAGVKPYMPSMTVHGASLPPFPWSHSQAGGCRQSVDCGKHGSSRSNSQWQWVRVGSNLTPLDYEDTSVHRIDDLLQEMDAAKLCITDSCDGQYNLCGTESTSGLLVQNIHSRKIGGEHGSQQLQPLDHVDSLDGFQKHDSEHSLLKTSQVSPKIQRAAEILCDMKRSTESWSGQGYSNGAIKWPKSPSEKVMKARKPSSQFGTAESSSGSRNNDATWNGSSHSTKKIVDRKNDSARLNNPGKGTIKWPVPVEDSASPVRSERGLMVDTRQPHGNGGRHPVQVSSQARLEKEYENQQKLRKATLTSSLGSAGDWNRERNRRM